MVAISFSETVFIPTPCLGELEYGVRQKSRLLECGWQGNNMGVMIYSFNLDVSPKISYDVLECSIIMLQNYMLMII